MENRTMAFELSDDTPENLREYVKRLETENTEAKAKAEAEGSAARELAFIKAGVNPDDKQAKFFVKAYDGELTPEAIKAAATEAGFIQADPPPPEQGQSDRIGRGEAGGTGNEVTDKDAFIAEMRKVHGEGGNPALTAMLDKHGIGVTTVQ